jgi:hypothetical protein
MPGELFGLAGSPSSIDTPEIVRKRHDFVIVLAGSHWPDTSQWTRIQREGAS